MKVTFSAIAAITLDGKIAAGEKQFTSWTSREDKKFLRSFLDRSDAVVVGRNTYETAKKPLSKRNCIVLTRSVSGVVRKKKNLIYLNPQKTDILKFVKKFGWKQVAVLGGTKTYTYFLEKGLLDELYLTVEPVVFCSGLPLFNGKFKIRKPRIISIKKLNRKGSILIHARFV